MDTQRAAEIQVVLEGIRLPATREELVAYAMQWDPDAAAELAELPDRSFSRIDEVGEALVRVQPGREPKPRRPPAEDELPPGGESYFEPNSESGSIQLSAPPDNPPQKAIENASETLKRQAAVQG